MEMTDKDTGRLHAALLALLRSGLWEKEVDDLSGFPLSAQEWEGVFRLSRIQTVTGLVFQGLHYLPDGLLPSESLLFRWAAETDAIERKNRKMNRSMAGLHALFQSGGLEPILQKGQGVAQFYERPLLRECGDIDFCFPETGVFSAAASLVRQRGVSVKKMPGRSLFYVWEGTVVEHHLRLFDLHNPFLQRVLRTLEAEKGFDRLCILPPSGLQVCVPSPLLNLLMLNLHILKHALGWGIGLRQLCDMARAYHRLHERVDSREMEAVSRKLGLKHWNPLLHAFLTGHLGLPVASLPYETVSTDARPLFDIVWRGGNFGYQLAGRQASGHSVWGRKLRTAGTLLQHLRFARHYAPKETFWMVGDLLKGQFQ